MTTAISPLIYIAIFAAVLLLFAGIYLLVFGKSIERNSVLNRRMVLIEKARAKKDVLEQLRKERASAGRKGGIPIFGTLEDRVRKANLSLSPQSLILMMIGVSAAMIVLLGLTTAAELSLRIVVGVALGFGGVFMWISGKAKKRIAAIEEQLPEAIDLIVRSLRVGHPLAAALAMAGDELPDPLGTELALISDEISYGRDAGEALADFAERIDLQDLRFLSIAVMIQQRSGGNLAEILDGLSKVVRARFKLFRRVRAMTAEAKWSGIFLSGFPIGAMIMIQLLKPDYYDVAKEHPLFMPLAVVVFGFLLVNVIYMRKMTDIKI
jgi:tight adherence protein B